MGRRRQAREIALQALYLVDVAHTQPSEAFAIVNRHAGQSEAQTLDFARSLLEGAVAKLAEIDAHISATAENWPIKRMAAVDRNVLRLAAFELAYERDTPVGVVIDEAIEIVRKYSTEDATKFINGILDKLKALRPASDAPPKDPS
ncbi:MAG: transcription antitermination factor NusB [Elusimicrobia bacterium]|nr:transcription antitermination factor NusB [Elusimicrobiota bacterium]